jgi:hypothetical protein
MRSKSYGRAAHEIRGDIGWRGAADGFYECFGGELFAYFLGFGLWEPLPPFFAAHGLPILGSSDLQALSP